MIQPFFDIFFSLVETAPLRRTEEGLLSSLERGNKNFRDNNNSLLHCPQGLVPLPKTGQVIKTIGRYILTPHYSQSTERHFNMSTKYVFSQKYVNVGKNKVVSQQLFKASQHHLLLYFLRRMHSFEKRIFFAYTAGSLLCIRPRCIVVDLYLTSPLAVSRIHQCMHRRLYSITLQRICIG